MLVTTWIIVTTSAGVQASVLLWKLKEKDLEALDRYEGYPHFYRKEILPVELKGKTVQAMVYIMNDGHSFGAPSDYYLNTILEYTVAVPLKSLPDIYKNLEITLGRAITYEDQANASEIYYRIRIKT